MLLSFSDYEVQLMHSNELLNTVDIPIEMVPKKGIALKDEQTLRSNNKLRATMIESRTIEENKLRDELASSVKGTFSLLSLIYDEAV